MKWLISLSVLQSLLLAMLGLHAIKLDMRTGEIAETVDTIKAGAQNASSAEPLQWAEAAPAAGLDADDIRQIIREEFEAVAAEGGASVQPVSHASTSAPQQIAAYDKTQTLMTQSAIDQDLDRYKKIGAISTIEMDELHAKIAELPPEARRAALIRLTRAINSGEIRGQF